MADKVTYIRKWWSIGTIEYSNNTGFVPYMGVSYFDK